MKAVETIVKILDAIGSGIKMIYKVPWGLISWIPGMKQVKFLKGWKTIIASTALIVIGVLEKANIYEIFVGWCETGWTIFCADGAFMIVFGAIMGVLRVATNTEAGKK